MIKTPFSFFLSPNAREINSFSFFTGDKMVFSSFLQGNKARGEIPMKYLLQSTFIKNRYRILLLKSFVRMDYSPSLKNNEKRAYLEINLENNNKIKSN